MCKSNIAAVDRRILPHWKIGGPWHNCGYICNSSLLPEARTHSASICA
jgi:hypothetical protein